MKRWRDFLDAVTWHAVDARPDLYVVIAAAFALGVLAVLALQGKL
jgi:hypothetical protein